MNIEASIYTLFYKTTKLGTVIPESDDFPNQCGSFTKHPSLLRFENGELMDSLIDYAMKTARLLDSGLSTTELENKYRDLMPSFMNAIESDDWYLIDGDGNEKSILAPNFQADGGIVWRCN